MTLEQLCSPCSSRVLIHADCQQLIQECKTPPLECFQRGTLTLWFSPSGVGGGGLANRFVLFFSFLPVPPFVSYQSPLHVSQPFSLQRKRPLCATGWGLTAFNHRCRESRKSHKSFTRHIASYLVAKGSTDWRRQLFLLVSLHFTDY